jgi:hypothetical protein
MTKSAELLSYCAVIFIRRSSFRTSGVWVHVDESIRPLLSLRVRIYLGGFPSSRRMVRLPEHGR